MEGCLTGAIPIVPDRCSYREMYLPEFKYPTEWTSSIENYNKYKEDLVHFINDKVKNFLQYEDSVKQQQQIIKENYFNADIMFKKLLGI